MRCQADGGPSQSHPTPLQSSTPMSLPLSTPSQVPVFLRRPQHSVPKRGGLPRAPRVGDFLSQPNSARGLSPGWPGCKGERPLAPWSGMLTPALTLPSHHTLTRAHSVHAGLRTCAH